MSKQALTEKAIRLLESGLSVIEVGPLLREIRYETEPGLWPRFEFLMEDGGYIIRTGIPGVDHMHEIRWDFEEEPTAELLDKLKSNILLVLRDCLEEPGKPAVPTGYYHPILLLSDELRANEKTRGQWRRPKIADEYYKRLDSKLKSVELQSAGGSREALREKYVNILRNYKDQLLYP